MRHAEVRIRGSWLCFAELLTMTGCASKHDTLAFFLGMERMLSDQALKQGRMGDALAHTGDEGRSTLR